MNYERKYRKALERMKSWARGEHPEYFTEAQKAAEFIFPELAESEEERMRKELLDYLKERQIIEGLTDTKVKMDWVTWLEKQGKKTNPYSGISFEYNGHTWGMCARDNGVDILLDKQLFTHLEKQGKHKDTNLAELLKLFPRETELYSPLYGKLWLAEVDEEHGIITCYKYRLDEGCTRATLEQENTVSFYSNGTTGLPDCTISKDCMLFLYDFEKQSEQKDPCEDCSNPKLNCSNFPCIKKRAFDSGKSVFECIKTEHEQKIADTVDPKFKVGDWLQYRSAEPFLVEEITEQGYINGNSCLPFEWENEIHLWTVQDTKEGDVLACNEEILLFKSYSVQGRISLYCWYNGQTNNFHSKEVNDKLLTTRNKICPATKEQRDTLFAKMKEAGYEWNADKKELKKIEQKSAWSEDDEIGLDDALWCCKQAASIAKDENDMGNAWYAENWLKSIKDRIGSGLICTVKDDESTDEQKPADKVKPKFKAGDWIVDNRTGVVHYIAKIKGTVDGCYYVLGYDKGLLHVDNESDYHLWTIKNAKDGDVLVVDSRPFIYDGSKNAVTVGAYCGFNTENMFSCAYHAVINRNIVPATKEQYDHLFQKMEELGYMWDSHAKMIICSTDIKLK